MSVRILHLADAHLAAPLGNFGSYAARRRDEVDQAFRRAVLAALAERVHAVLIAGDLFDTHRPDARAVELVRRELARLREAGIRILAVPGTHDSLLQPDCVYRRESLPFDRLFDEPSFAGPERVEADEGVLWVYGIACDPRREAAGWDTLERVPEAGIHVALAHAACRDRPDWTISPEDLPFDEEDLPGLGMDYLALGHYHNHRAFKDEGGRILGAYPGSVEGRDWTEPGPRHALLVQWDAGSPEPSLRPIPVHSRVLSTCELDVSGSATEEEVRELVRERCAPETLWRIVLVGEPEIPLRPDSIAADLEAVYGHIQVADLTTLVTSRKVAQLCEEQTVRGEFFRRLVEERERAQDVRQRRVADRAVKLGVRVFG
ncbi:MAG: metallophosphoesterase family protein [Gemmatimonadota bacterium]